MNGFAIYIHWPFCLSKCPYCDFNSHVEDSVDQGRWRDAYLRALDRYAGETSGRVVDSLFFGGGTPSLMEPATVGAVIQGIKDLWLCETDMEVTVEANPTSAETGLFQAFSEAGVNRLSLGVQSFDDAALSLLGRGHDAREARRAIGTARDAVSRVSFDLIYAWPGQTADHWRGELAEALALTGDHLSVYQLTIARGTPFHDRNVSPAEEAVAAELFDATQETLAAAGLRAYEISNHARPGAECRHNLSIWRGADYVGLGPGAHGRLTLGGTCFATQAPRHPETWLRAAETGRPADERTPLTPAERRDELLLMGLRLADGVDLGTVAAGSGLKPAEIIAPARLKPLIQGGFLEQAGGALKATDAGRRALDSVLARLLV